MAFHTLQRRYEPAFTTQGEHLGMVDEDKGKPKPQVDWWHTQQKDENLERLTVSNVGENVEQQKPSFTDGMNTKW